MGPGSKRNMPLAKRSVKGTLKAHPSNTGYLIFKIKLVRIALVAIAHLATIIMSLN